MLYCAHQGGNADGEIWVNSYNEGGNPGGWLGDQHIASQVGITDSPALAVFNNALYCVHQGPDSKGDLLFTSSTDGTNWQGEVQIADNIMSNSPALAVFNNALYCVYRGITDVSIHYSVYTNGQWTADQTLPNNLYLISGSPSLVVFNNALYLVHMGDLGGLYYTYTSDGQYWQQDTQILPVSGSPAPNSAPSLAVFNNTLYCAFGYGPNTNTCQLAYITFDGTNWSTPAYVPVPTGSSAITLDPGTAPSLAVFDDVLYCFYSVDLALWYVAYFKNLWTFALSVPATSITASPSACVFTPATTAKE